MSYSDFKKGSTVELNGNFYVVKSIGRYDIKIEDKSRILVIPFDHPYYNAIRKLNHD